MYEYSRHRITKEKLCSMKRQTFRLFCCVLLVVVLVVLAVVLAAVLTRKLGSTTVTTGTPPSFNQTCQEFVQLDDVDSGSFSHSRCEKRLPIAEECSVTEQDSWISLLNGSSSWNEALSLLPKERRENVSTLIVSPPMLIQKDSCAIQISFDLESDSPIQVYFNLSQIEVIPVSVTSDRCHYGVITDRVVLTDLRSFRVIIASDGLIANDITYGSVTSHRCVEFSSLRIFTPTATENPTFESVPRGEQNLCSMNLENQDIECDWFNVIGLSNEHFRLGDFHSCLERGVSKPDSPEEVNFLTLETNFPNSRDYIISPIVEGGTSFSRISFWYLAQCSGSVIRFFIVHSHHDVIGIGTRDILPVFELPLVKATVQWTHMVIDVPVPATYSSYHIVLEATISSEGNCTGYLCNPPRAFAEKPLLALDEIAVEARFDQCNVTNSTGVDTIDCSFENATDNSSTLCSWRSSLPAGLDSSNSMAFIFSHWKVDNRGNADTADHGATHRHFEGRGYVITYTHVSGAFVNFFQTPRLVANSQCSCHMNFKYLLRGFFAPRLQVNLVVDTGDDDYELLPQWSVVGHQSDEWLDGDALLNLPMARSFRVEFIALEFRDSKAEVNIDDITFTNCDFRLFGSIGG